MTGHNKNQSDKRKKRNTFNIYNDLLKINQHKTCEINDKYSFIST